MSDVLDRAKGVQQKIAAETPVTIRLNLLEGLIAEIETLKDTLDALRQEHPAHKLREVKVSDG